MVSQSCPLGRVSRLPMSSSVLYLKDTQYCYFVCSIFGNRFRSPVSPDVQDGGDGNQFRSPVSPDVQDGGDGNQFRSPVSPDVQDGGDGNQSSSLEHQSAAESAGLSATGRKGIFLNQFLKVLDKWIKKPCTGSILVQDTNFIEISFSFFL